MENSVNEISAGGTMGIGGSLRMSVLARQIVVLVLISVFGVGGVFDFVWAAGDGGEATVRGGFRGVFFNPNIIHPGMEGYPMPVFSWYDSDTAYRTGIRSALTDLVKEAGINFIDVFIAIPHTLKKGAQGPAAGQSIGEWADLVYLDNVAMFVDDCHEAGIYVEFDLVDNRWIPYSVDSARHIGQPGGTVWPVADDTPWEESATWYSEVIEYVESRAKHPENIALWSMMGNYQLGTAEPITWEVDGNPAINAYTEKFVKYVWPVFRAAGKRPKGAPYAFAILSNKGEWMGKSAEQRLAGFTNLKKWLVEDIGLGPDYWPMSTYTFSDPAGDGVYYLRKIVEILGEENAGRILSTDFKGPGHEEELKESIVSAEGRSGREMLEWHFGKCREYGFAGWWIWSYQDRGEQRTGIRGEDGEWKAELLEAVKGERR